MHRASRGCTVARSPRRCWRRRCGRCWRRHRACSPRSPTTPPPRPRWSTRTASSRPSTTAALDALARTGRRAGDVVRITRRARAALAPEWYDERDLMDAAVDAIGGGVPLLADLGTVVLYLPQELSAPVASLLSALAARTPVTVVAGLTGRSRADAPVRAAVGRLGVTVPDVPIDPDPETTRVVSASDPDDEVRAVVRLVIDARARRCAARAHGRALRRGRAVRPAGARAARRRRHHPQRRGGAHARRRACWVGDCSVCSRSPTATTSATT